MCMGELKKFRCLSLGALLVPESNPTSIDDNEYEEGAVETMAFHNVR